MGIFLHNPSCSFNLADEKAPAATYTPPHGEHALTYEEREAEIERGDGEVLLMLDTTMQKSGAHVDQYKMAADGKVLTFRSRYLCHILTRSHRPSWFLNRQMTPMIP